MNWFVLAALQWLFWKKRNKKGLYGFFKLPFHCRRLLKPSIFRFLLIMQSNKISPLRLWRLPNESKIHLVISKRPEFLKYTATLEDLPSGFIVAPFEAAADRIYLKADYSFSFSNGQLNEPTTSLEDLIQRMAY